MSPISASTTPTARTYRAGELVLVVGFVAVLTGGGSAIPLLPDRRVIEVADEVDATDTELLAELREIGSQLDRVVARLEQRPGS